MASDRSMWLLSVSGSGSRYSVECGPTGRSLPLFTTRFRDLSALEGFLRTVRPRWSGPLGEEPGEGENELDGLSKGIERLKRDGSAAFALQNRNFDDMEELFRASGLPEPGGRNRPGQGS
jgi:hypothetical protein